MQWIHRYIFLFMEMTKQLFLKTTISFRNRGISEHRRSLHINCEQNRRTSIKHGFEELRSLIPSLRNSPTSSHKISKAALLHKGE